MPNCHISILLDVIQTITNDNCLGYAKSKSTERMLNDFRRKCTQLGKEKKEQDFTAVNTGYTLFSNMGDYLNDWFGGP